MNDTDRLAALLTPWRWTAIGYANAMLTIIAIAAVVMAVKA
jgi:hypothetical protein